MSTILGFTLAVIRMEEMLEFYSKIFGITFECFDEFGTTMYRGKWGKFNILFCPAHVANNTAKQNRHQLDIEVKDINETILLIKSNKGELMGSLSKKDTALTTGCYDPDRNSLVLKQRIV